MRRVGTLLTALLLAASPAIAGDASSWISPDWFVDFASARAMRGDPIELGADGGMIGDRVLVDLRHRANGTTATLTLRCAAQRYSITREGNYKLVADAPVADWPLAAALLSSYCEHIDDLPSADTLVPVI